MDHRGKSSLTTLIVIMAVLVCALAGLFAYMMLGDNDNTGEAVGGKNVEVSEEDGRIVLVDEDGKYEEIPNKIAIAGINTTEISMISELFKEAEKEAEQNGSAQESENPEDITSTPEITDVPEKQIKSLSEIVDSTFDTAQLSLAYYENNQKYLEILGYNNINKNDESSGSGENTEDDPEKLENVDDPEDKKTEEEPIVYLNAYYEGTEDRSVAVIQERLMQLGFMEFAEPTEYYGSITMEAVKLFQRQNELKQDGIIGEQSLAILFGDNAKSYMLKKGMDGEDVRNVQMRLYELGYLANTSQLTGHFGDDTDNAVKSLQAANGLTADGKIGVMTNELLYSESVKANLISFGDKSDVVLACQERLKKLGYLTTTPDGFYGDDTLAAVKLFQSRNDCIVDGYLGPSTRAALLSSSARPNGLVVGDKNDTVKKVQQLLIKYGYLNSGSDTGYFGDVTEAAVKKFQSRNNLSVDGNVGQMTMSVLTGNNVVKASSGNGGSGNGGSGNGGSGNGGSGNGGSGNGGGSHDSGGSGTVVYYNCSADDLIKVAKSKIGCKYVWGSKGPNTFDCSGFVYWCLKQIGVKQSYITSLGWRTVGKYKKITSLSNVKKGDIIVVYGHVGIAAGNGEVIDASSSNGKIVYRTMGDWWRRNFICAWRIFD